MEGVNKQAVDEGWIPVIHKHSRLGGIIDSRKPLISLFVDNLPEDTSQPWLKMMFNKFGVVKDVFIPEKRSKATGNRFGFIRYDCPVSADLAILRTNGVWLDDKKLFVKLASFEAKRNKTISSHSYREGVILKAGMGQNNEQGSKANVLGQNLDYSQQGFLKDKKTYAQVTRGVERLGEQNARKSIQCVPIGNGWLYRSAIAKIRKLLSTKDLECVFNFEKVHDVQIKAIGGRYVIITFANEGIRDKIVKEKWVLNWFEDIKSWNGEHAKEERFVWISCFGMPLSAWSSQTFKEIGSIWGDFLKVDENTLRGGSYEKGRILIATDQTQRIEGVVELVVDGIRYPVRIEEEASFRKVESSNFLSENAKAFGIDSVSVNEDQLSQVPKDPKEDHSLEKQSGKVSNSLHSLDSLVGLESLVMESFVHSFPGKDIGVKSLGVCMSSEDSDPIQSADDDDCHSLDLISADPLINYVELKRHKKKSRSKQRGRKKSIPFWRPCPLKATLFSRPLRLDKKESCSRRSKLDKENLSSNEKSLLGPGPLYLGDSRLSESGSMHTTQEDVSSKEKMIEEESIATLATGNNLAVNLHPEDALVLKEMIEEELQAYSHMARKWEESTER